MTNKDNDIFFAFDHLAILIKDGKKITNKNIKDAAEPFEDLTRIFDLNEFEIFVLIACLGVETHNDLREILTDNQEPFFVTIDRLCSLYKEPNWHALTPNSLLFEYGLLHRNHTDMPFPASTLRASEWMVHHAMGEITLPASLHDIQAVTAPDNITPHQDRHIKTIRQSWQNSIENHHTSTLTLEGSDTSNAKDIASLCCQSMGFLPYEISSFLLPQQPEKLHDFLIAWSRHHLCYAGILILNLDGLNREQHSPIYATVEQIIAKDYFPLILIGADKALQNSVPTLTHTLSSPSYDDKLALIQTIGNNQKTSIQAYLQDIAWHFSLNASLIDKIQAVIHTHDGDDESALRHEIYTVCCDEFKTDFKGLADYVETQKTWDDLIVPQTIEQELHTISDYIRHQKTIYHDWGFGEKQNQVGVCALFSGASGTGKTTAAAILAQELNLKLVRVNLSAVVSKYIGETEKNLATIFDAAEQSNVLLLFDEADALFGKRSEVKDSRDRYANMEVSYLLQRIESYSGLAVLTTNIKESFDKAFTRRFRFMIDFPFPAQEQRQSMWQRMLPTKMPIDDLDYKKLALINVTGGMIYNIILRAAHIAAAQDTSLTMKMLAEATRLEFSKDNRQIPETILQGWDKQTSSVFLKNIAEPHTQAVQHGT